MGKCSFEITPTGFLLNGAPFRFIAGAIHYFRVPEIYWRDRLIKLKECGFNTVETYVAWNAHEMREGQFDFSGMLDIEKFLTIAQELGLYAIIRPGPYICSEWEFGGLPWWLLKKEGIQLRCMNQPYLDAVDRFFDVLMEKLSPLKYTNGGPILMMQVENEYGSYGDDTQYLEYLADGMKKRGIDVPFFTSDGPTDFMLTGGTINGIHKTANFGSKPQQSFAKLREFQPDGPLMCMEYWNGWFDHWFEPHHSRDPQDAANVLDEMLSSGASVCTYMFHGGTIFGLMNGANNYNKYEPTINSYDDDAPLNEYGEPTKKYWLFRDVVGKYVTLPPISFETKHKSENYGEIVFTQSAKLFDQLENLSIPIQTTTPLPMEFHDQGYGLILYRSHVRGPREEMNVVLQDVHDRAHIYADGQRRGIVYRDGENEEIKVKVPREGIKLDVLVENLGRANYGYHMMDYKGITQGIRLGQTFLFHWDTYCLPLNNIQKLKYADSVDTFDGTPMFLKATFRISNVADTFVKLPGFQKGFIFINGVLLSRYWEVGPQHSAYLPASMLKMGENVLEVLELDGYDNPSAILDDCEDIGRQTE